MARNRVPRVLPDSSRSAFPQSAGQPVSAWSALAEVAAIGRDVLQPVLDTKLKEAGTQAVYRDSDGVLRVDEMSLLAGDMAVTHNTAAYATYLAKAGIDARDSVSELTRRFEFDPKGFREAAGVYKSKAMEGAPTLVAADLDVMISQEISRGSNGLAIRQVSRTRDEAEASTRARWEMLANDLGTIIEAGDRDSPEFARITAEMNSIARFREGMHFQVPEQSEQNMGIAMAKGEAKRRARIETQAGQAVEMARNGLAHPNEQEILQDVRGTDLESPLLYAVEARNQFPNFALLSPEAQALIIDEFKAMPQGEGAIETLNELVKINEATRKAVAKDVIGLVKQRKILDIPDLDLNDPASFNQRLQAVRALSQLGFYPDKRNVRFFDDAEIVQLKTDLSAMGPVEQMASITNIIGGAGHDAAIEIFRQIGVQEPFTYAAQMMAAEIDPEIPMRMLMGAAIEAKDKIPLKAEAKALAMKAILPKFELAIDDEARNEWPRILVAADNIYQGRGVGFEDEVSQQKAYGEAIMMAIGANNGRGGLIELASDNIIMLPPSVTGDEVEKGLKNTFGLLGAVSSVPRTGVESIGQETGIPETTEEKAIRIAKEQGIGRDLFNGIWRQASIVGGDFPIIGENPLPDNSFGYMHFKPVKHDIYKMVYTLGGKEVTALSSSRSGEAYLFSMTKFVDLTR